MADWQQSLDAVVRARGAALVGYAFLLSGDRREAEDLVQDALVKTYSRGRVTGGPENVEGYVRRAILSTYLDGFRRRKRWAAIRHLTEPGPSPAPADQSVDRMDVRTALAQLSPRERACLVLRFYEDLTVPRIAEALSLSQGTVKRYLSDATRRMEQLLGPVHDPHHADDVAVDIQLVTTRRKP